MALSSYVSPSPTASVARARTMAPRQTAATPAAAPASPAPKMYAQARTQPAPQGVPQASIGAPVGDTADATIQGGGFSPYGGAPAYSTGAPAPKVTAGAPARNPALDATYIGRSKGKQMYLGPDGKQYTNQQREQAGMAEDDAASRGLDQRWNQMIDRAGGQSGRATDDYWSQAGQADEAINRVGDWAPTEQEGFDLSFLRDQQPTNRQGWKPTALAGANSAELRGTDLSRIQNYQPTALKGVNTGQLRGYNAGGTISDYLAANGGGAVDPNTFTAQAGTSSYDPTVAVGEYARGASGESKRILQDQLDQETNAAARTGRLNTGAFDRDKGRVITRVGEDLNDKISQQAVNAAQIKASIENSNSGNITNANIATARGRGDYATQMASLRSGEARDAASLGLTALDRATGYDTDIATSLDKLGLDAADKYTGHALDRAGQIDRNTLTAAEATDRLTQTNAGEMDDFLQKGATNYGTLELDRRKGVDTGRYGAVSDAANMRLKRYGTAGDVMGNSLDREGDLVSSAQDRITGRQNFRSALSAQKGQNRQNLINGIIRGGAGLAAAAM